MESLNNNVPFNDLIIKYLQLGIKKDNLINLKSYESRSEYPPYKTVYIPEILDNFFIKKAKDNNIGKGTFFLNYLISGIEQEKGDLSPSLKQWFNNLKDIS